MDTHGTIAVAPGRSAMNADRKDVRRDELSHRVSERRTDGRFRSSSDPAQQ
jgi:hypothetical protein